MNDQDNFDDDYTDADMLYADPDDMAEWIACVEEERLTAGQLGVGSQA